MNEFAPGLFLKITSMLGRVFFLFTILPSLYDGELTDYLFYTTVALLGARLLAFGIEDELPLTVRGDRSIAEKYLQIYLYVVLIGLAVLFFASIVGSNWVLAAFLLVAYIAQFLLSGVLRSIRVVSYEIMANISWVIYPASCWLASVKTADQMLMWMGVSLMLNHVLVIASSGLAVRLGNLSLREAGTMLTRVRKGWLKCFSNFVDLVNIRGLILWPKVFRQSNPSDELAFALACGEVSWQFFLIVVQRRYARYCNDSNDRNSRIGDATKTGLILIILGGMGGILAVFIGPHVVNFEKLSWPIVGPIIFMFGVIAAYFLLRYAVWSLRGYLWQFLRNEILLVVANVSIIAFAPMTIWPELVALAFLAHYAISVALVRSL